MRASLRRLCMAGVMLSLAAVTLGLFFGAQKLAVHGIIRPAHRDALPGFTIARATPRSGGLVVTSVRTDSEAQALGMAAGDRLVAVDEKSVKSISDARRDVANAKGPRLHLDLVRDHIRRTLILQHKTDRHNEP
ncbi:PDZ domain-containing protein [Novosphingobium sp. PP1Y]|uniref:PDZ domain-containing protein n=1 Tax=Novosphingobium sp. PP1Y TaxID=702113 RepID=UPI0013146D2A|nr:PDZ domain-containing protein [Novosphingobium sp. PP1Y]